MQASQVSRPPARPLPPLSSLARSLAPSLALSSFGPTASDSHPASFVIIIELDGMRALIDHSALVRSALLFVLFLREAFATGHE